MRRYSNSRCSRNSSFSDLCSVGQVFLWCHFVLETVPGGEVEGTAVEPPEPSPSTPPGASPALKSGVDNRRIELSGQTGGAMDFPSPIRIACKERQFQSTSTKPTYDQFGINVGRSCKIHAMSTHLSQSHQRPLAKVWRTRPPRLIA